MTIQFDSYKYYPALRTRPAEIQGYRELDSEIKNALLPIFTLGAWPRAEGVMESAAQMLKALDGRPVIVDVTREGPYQNAEAKALLNSADNFKAWRDFIEKIPNAIPVVQITAEAKQSALIRQARKLEELGLKRLAFRITDYVTDTPKVINALSSLDSPENALVIIDAGYIRETLASSIAACITSINDIRDEIPETIISVISSSFPSSVTTFKSDDAGKTGIINILERELHAAIGDDAAIYGDHGSIHAKVHITRGGTYVPHIDLSLYDAWAYERRPGQDSSGYIDAAKTILEKYPQCKEDESWGAQMIRKAASGNIEGLKMRSCWIAVRVNMHLTRQFELSQSTPSSDLEEDEE